MRFYPDAVAVRFEQATVLCLGTESSRPQQCEKIATHALAQGIVTTNAMYSSPDALSLPYKFLEHKYPTTNYATLSQTDRVPARNMLARRDYEQFKQAALPRAFAVSANGMYWAWSGNDALASEVALGRCKAKAGGTTTGVKCVLYALDERIVYGGK